ncbi:MAG: formate--tetrahydrofolate ligase [Chitinivibrionales bacterium]|nr:formate--tetrahydrofolate ligase [Chitinivibrionales bacterium]
MKSDIEIAQAAEKSPIRDIAARIGLDEADIIPYGAYIAKTPFDRVVSKPAQLKRKLILTTAMTPTPMGEGKTTNTIGLGQAMDKIGKKTMIAIREPSLGPCMGVKGGAAGGGYSQVLPMEDINLHFTGDLHAVTMAHNLLAAVIDNHLHQKNEPDLHSRRIVWKRVLDMNDRSLRNTIVGCQRDGSNGVMREDGFEITAASEVMAILCLANDLMDLKARLGRIVVGYDSLRKPVTAADLGVNGAMAALLKNAIHPNLVQTIEGVPVFVHGGPFANIAHGCNTVIATKLAMHLADYTITEAGFGADLGAEKFFNIKCRSAGLRPDAVMLVVTHRAYTMHGIDNIVKHVENVRQFNVPVIVSINRFLNDDPADLKMLQQRCADAGIPAAITDFREGGGEGGLEIAEKICELCEQRNTFDHLYPLDMPLVDKINTISTRIYGARGVEFTATAKRSLKRIANLGFAHLPVCIAKTPASLSDNPKFPGRPKNFSITVTDARVSAGAGYVVVYSGDIMTMPGLPKTPAAMNIDIDRDGTISGLF